MLELRGGPAFTPARLENRLQALRAANAGVFALAAEYVHFVDAADLDAAEKEVLERLLSWRPRGEGGAPPGRKLWVIPRLGTISPWSSKATDIARICGLAKVRRIERGIAYTVAGEITDRAALLRGIHDRMTETVIERSEEAGRLFAHAVPRPLERVAVLERGRAAIEAANGALGLALSAEEIDYIVDSYRQLERNPTDVELMMFAQANSEHCRHKTFNADFVVDGERQGSSLFQLIRKSTEASPGGVLSAYRDNASVIEGQRAGRFFPDPTTRVYRYTDELVHILMKVETHNHPTAISPYPGAATGSGGEIRDEGATGRGAKPKAGLTGFSVSNLRLPGAWQPWEVDHGKPAGIASALDIMIEGPIGAAAFNNEFGRPNLVGYFRTFELEADGPAGREVRGYHKPIMLAGGLGNIRTEHVKKAEVPPGTPIVVLGGPAMLIGLGGGAASSVASGALEEDLDFASVQRDNAEMQRRCQEVIDRAWALGKDNPILSIHDVGAGGLSNALPELVHDSRRGARFELRKIPSDEPGMSPLEIWCNEAQERYVVAVAADRLADFEALCRRERCPHAVVGSATEDDQLVVHDAHFENRAVELPLATLFSNPPRPARTAVTGTFARAGFDAATIDVREAVLRVLRLPAVADKTFLVTIGDRTVGGLVARDQMVGPWQVPVADAALTAASYDSYAGEAMAIGERTPVALLGAGASARMAVAEAITNIASAPIAQLSSVKLSTNWMVAAGHPGEDARLYEAVRAVGAELCPALGIAIPVGKDSMSMRTVWQEAGQERRVVAPLSLIVSAFAPVTDIRLALTPELRRDAGESLLVLVDLGRGRDRLGASALAQVFGQLGDEPADLDDPALLTGFFAAVQRLNREGLLLAYHDRSDGGSFVTLLEMAFAGGAGLDVELSPDRDPVAALFSEELGAVLQVRTADLERVQRAFAEHDLGACVSVLGRPTDGDRVVIRCGGQEIFAAARSELRAAWSEVTHRMQVLRDDPSCADEEHALRCRTDDPGLNASLTFDPAEDVSAPYLNRGARPRVAILREQGVNGQIEMAAAFDRAGFDAVDVHMSDVLGRDAMLQGFHGLVACGGFSYGDVLGAGVGWAASILLDPRARREFEAFFRRSETFVLGVCNGCQMLSNLRELIPGASAWPRFLRNRSEQFEARLSMIEVLPNPSIFLSGMAGSRLPIAVSHGEGRAEFTGAGDLDALERSNLVAARYVDHRGRPTQHYPENPNGSPGGATAFTTPDGRITVMMPHPERVFRTAQHSYHPRDWAEDGPWLRMFRNARVFVG